jgi:hypothetical protein
MASFQPLAHPLWVNLLALLPVVLLIAWRRRGLQISGRHIICLTLFAWAFGFVEAAVVVYLRAATGLLPGYTGTLSDVHRLGNGSALYPPTISQMPPGLLTIEVLREGATMVMLVSIAMLAATKARERWAVFLWIFAIWDISYYAGLWATIRWPTSLTDLDLLFLIPVPWMAQVWYPLLVSALTLCAVGLSRKQS